jgi:glycosyltransferase involved in cell wall biosynthesis
VQSRLIVHQFDPARGAPGGIDTCIRGLCRYLPKGSLAIVGVDATGGDATSRPLGVWETHTFGAHDIQFMPVARLDPANQRRRLPHSLRLIAGLIRFRRRVGSFDAVQFHRADTALVGGWLFPKTPLVYFIHTQRRGLVGKESDSVWKHTAPVHEWIEKAVIRRAGDVRVFNRAYASELSQTKRELAFSPTWFDPAHVLARAQEVSVPRIVWVGRLEQPKRPLLAVQAFEALCERDPTSRWELQLIGDGTLMELLKAHVSHQPPDIRSRVTLSGRLSIEAVGEAMSRGSVFLMTSVAGYEGFPRVLVEALAAGLPAVVTPGADTGALVDSGLNGIVCDDDKNSLAAALLAARHLDPADSIASVDSYSAPIVIGKLFQESV